MKIVRETEMRVEASISLGPTEAKSTPQDMFATKYGVAKAPSLVSVDATGQVLSSFPFFQDSSCNGIGFSRL